MEELYNDDNQKNVVLLAAKNLMEFVIKKYDVKSYDDFTCQHHEYLARALNLFVEKNGE